MNLRRTLIQSGLSDDEATVYTKVLEAGRLKAGSVIRTTSLKRGHVYNVLNELVKKDLLEKFDINGIAHYRLTHPSHLKQGITEKKNDLIRKENALERGLEDIVSAYNKGLHKPAVQYYEGSEGILKALYNSLETTETIYTYTDPRTVKKYMQEENDKYVKQRKKKNVKKKILFADSETARTSLTNGSREQTDVRIINNTCDLEIEAAIQIYDDTVTYLTISENRKIAAEITDPRIARLEKYIFESIWKQSE